MTPADATSIINRVLALFPGSAQGDWRWTDAEAKHLHAELCKLTISIDHAAAWLAMAKRETGDRRSINTGVVIAGLRAAQDELLSMERYRRQSVFVEEKNPMTLEEKRAALEAWKAKVQGQ